MRGGDNIKEQMFEAITEASWQALEICVPE